MSQQLQRYFAATLAFGLVAVWTATGFTAAVTSLLVSGAGYFVVVVAQRRMIGRFLGRKAPTRERLRTLDENLVRRSAVSRTQQQARAVRPARRPSPVRPLFDHDEQPNDTMVPVPEYGW